MLTAVITVILTFALTGLVGNRVIQAWQYRNWLSQQRILDAEREHKALEEIFDEVTSLAGKRQHRMRRLLDVLVHGDVKLVNKRLSEYDDSVVAWNERLNALFAKITMHLDWGLTKRLEDRIHGSFVSIGHDLERMTKCRLAKGKIPPTDISRVSNKLNELQATLFTFNRDTLKAISEKKRAIYREQELTENTLNSIPTWELFKALFQPRKQRNNVI